MSIPAGLLALLRESVGQPLTVELASRVLGMVDSPDQGVDPERFEPIEAHGVVFRIERIRDVLAEIRPLHAQHWAETEKYRSVVGLEASYDQYITSERSGAFVLFTCRERGVLVGYLMLDLFRSRHTSKWQAVEDAFFMTPAVRKGFRAVAFLRYALGCLTDLQFRQAVFTSKPTKDIGVLLRRVGFVKVADAYSINLGAD